MRELAGSSRRAFARLQSQSQTRHHGDCSYTKCFQHNTCAQHTVPLPYNNGYYCAHNYRSCTVTNTCLWRQISHSSRETADTICFLLKAAGLDKKRARRTGAAASVSPKQGEACELAGVTSKRQAMPLSIQKTCAREYMEKSWGVSSSSGQ